MRLTSLGLSCMLVVAALAAGVAPRAAAADQEYEMERRSYIVKTRVGKIYVEVVHPSKGGKIVKAPALLTYTPYWALGVGENLNRADDAAQWVPDGYARVSADVVGTGNSGGCWDYGGDREKKSAHDIVEWIAKQKWSTGKVGMFGASYEGTTATAAAVTKPKGLVTIVPEAAISRWYGYAYSGGMRYFLNNEKPGDEGFDTPLLFDGGLAVPPPIDVQGEDWAGRFQESVTPCDEIQHTEKGYDDTPDYDKFWVERDYLREADKIDIPVMVAHNWGDWNVKQEEGWNLYHALKRSPQAVMFFGDRYSGHGIPGGTYEKVRKDWFDYYLKGERNATPNLPSIVSQTANYDEALKFLSAPRDFKTRDVELTAQYTGKSFPEDYEWKLLPEKARKSENIAEFLAVGINTESHANHHMAQKHDWFWFQTHALKRDTRIFGEIKLKVKVSSPGRKWITLTPGIVDVDMDCHKSEAGQHFADPTCMPRAVQSVTRGFLDSRYRNGLAKQALVEPGAPVSMTVVENPIDYVFKKGHHIGLSIATEINEWALPKPYPCPEAGREAEACTYVRVHWENGETKLILPIVDPPRDPRELFDPHVAHNREGILP